MLRKQSLLLISTLIFLTGCNGQQGGGGGLFGTHFVIPSNIERQSAYQLSAAEKKALVIEIRRGIGFSKATYQRGRQRKVLTKDGHERIELCAIMDLHRKTLFGGSPITYLVRAQFKKGQHKGMYVRVPSGSGTIALRQNCQRAGLLPN